MSKKIVVRLDLHDNKDKQKAIKAVSVLVGIDAISVDVASRKMTVIGTVDPVNVVSKLRKSWAAQLDSVGPAKEPEKKEEKKEADDGGKNKEGDAKKECDGAKEEGDGKEGDAKKEGGDAKKEGDGGKKEEGDDSKKDGDAKKEGGGGDDDKKVAPLPVPPLHHLPPPQYMNMITADYMNQYRPPPPPPPPAYSYAPPPPYYYVRNMSIEENPNSCAIC